jgi:hypothetical protein
LKSKIAHARAAAQAPAGQSYQPILTFIVETREYLWGEWSDGDRTSGNMLASPLTLF